MVVPSAHRASPNAQRTELSSGLNRQPASPGKRLATQESTKVWQNQSNGAKPTTRAGFSGRGLTRGLPSSPHGRRPRSELPLHSARCRRRRQAAGALLLRP